MPDKNFVSFENLVGAKVVGQTLVPDQPDYADTMKVFRCRRSVFDRFTVTGSTEDVIDVGRESCGNTFSYFRVVPLGKYCVTCKGGSHENRFVKWHLLRHGTSVDFEFGNWHSLNFDTSRDNVLESITAEDGQPITYCYRWGCRPRIVNTFARHLWWRSVGITVYWWAKYVAHRILRIPDRF